MYPMWRKGRCEKNGGSVRLLIDLLDSWILTILDQRDFPGPTPSKEESSYLPKHSLPPN